MCVKLFGNYLRVMLEVFWEDFVGKTIQKTTKKLQKPYFLLFKNSSK